MTAWCPSEDMSAYDRLPEQIRLAVGASPLNWDCQWIEAQLAFGQPVDNILGHIALSERLTARVH